MPRSRSKTKKHNKAKLSNRTGVNKDDEDHASDITQLSLEDDSNSVYAESITTTDLVNVDLTDEKIKESLENATHKNSSIRLEALKILQSIFASHYVPEHLLDWRLTAADAVEWCLKKKTGEECRRAVNLGTLLTIQLGTDFDQSATKFCVILKEWVADNTMLPEFRAQCANALSLYSYIAEEEPEVIVSALNLLEEIWARAKVINPALFSSCVNGWALLLLRLSNRYIDIALTKNLPILSDMLEHSLLEVRISSGETLCVLYELARQIPTYAQSNFAPPTHRKTLDLLDQMSHDSNNDVPEVRIKFGTEDLLLDSWSSKLCYNAFCSFLHGGINCHLQENVILRDIFGMGAPLLKTVSNKIAKSEKQRLNQSINKARSLIRDKQRDKRIASFV